MLPTLNSYSVFEKKTGQDYFTKDDVCSSSWQPLPTAFEGAYQPALVGASAGVVTMAGLVLEATRDKFRLYEVEEVWELQIENLELP